MTKKVITKAEAPRYQRDRITSYLLVSECTTGSRTVTTSLVEMEPGGKQHIHSHPNEQSYAILEGSGVMTVGGETFEVSAGQSIFIPSNAPHGLQNTGDSALRYLSAASPAFGGELEEKLWPLPPLRTANKTAPGDGGGQRS
jgi:quercetin dioxygenase-like cupin family protein